MRSACDVRVCPPPVVAACTAARWGVVLLLRVLHFTCSARAHLRRRNEARRPCALRDTRTFAPYHRPPPSASRVTAWSHSDRQSVRRIARVAGRCVAPLDTPTCRPARARANVCRSSGPQVRLCSPRLLDCPQLLRSCTRLPLSTGLLCTTTALAHSPPSDSSRLPT